MPLRSGDRVWIPDRESEARVEQEVAPRSFEMIKSDGVAIRRNQTSVHRLPEEETVPEQPPEEQENRESENEGQDPATTAEPTSEEQPPQTADNHCARAPESVNHANTGNLIGSLRDETLILQIVNIRLVCCVWCWV